MRSERTLGGHAHQAIYTSSGQWIRSGISAGSADRFAAFPANISPMPHLLSDVNPFIMALQLDGNSCERSVQTLNSPIMYEGYYVKQYLQVRPPVANGKIPLLPTVCASAE